MRGEEKMSKPRFSSFYEGKKMPSIDFEEEFWNAGLSNEKGVTEDDVDPEQLAMGIKVEMEHTTNKEASKKIALDHLAEIPDYYTRLAKMEKEAKDEEESGRESE